MKNSSSACIAGAFEHPLRLAPEHGLARIHAEVARGALDDAGLSFADVDGYFCAGDAPGLGPHSMVDYLGLKVRHVDSTDTGGSAPLIHAAHAAQAIAAGKCRIALVTMGGIPRSHPKLHAATVRSGDAAPEAPFEAPYKPTVAGLYALVARRHMHEYGTTPRQLAWIKSAFSQHAQHNPHAMLRNAVTPEEVLASPMVADPLHRLDCCVVSDGGGALVVVHPDVMKDLARPTIRIRGSGESVKGQLGGDVDLTWSATRLAAKEAFEEAGITPGQVQYASIYDSFTITVLMQLEDLGFCAKGEGGRFVDEGGLLARSGRLAVNTDGGGLCNNHPSNRGGMIKVIEAVRQLRGEAHPAVQVPGCSLALVSGVGGLLGSRHGSAVLILERE
jgi:acetyl-CoA C-acetyltransferase